MFFHLLWVCLLTLLCWTIVRPVRASALSAWVTYDLFSNLYKFSGNTSCHYCWASMSSRSIKLPQSCRGEPLGLVDVLSGKSHKLFTCSADAGRLQSWISHACVSKCCQWCSNLVLLSRARSRHKHTPLLFWANHKEESVVKRCWSHSIQMSYFSLSNQKPERKITCNSLGQYPPNIWSKKSADFVQLLVR